MQRARSARVRTAALTTTVGLCLVIPLAAASADSRSKSPTSHGSSVVTTPVPSASYEFGNGVDPDAPVGAEAVKQILAGTKSPSGKGTSSSAGTPVPAATPAPGAPAAGTVPTAGPTAAASTAVANTVCGKAVEAPGGVRAQTCVVREGGELWARLHYRNPTAEPLTAALVLLRPDNGTIRINCTIDPAAGDSVCETPRLRTDDPLAAWSAIAEVATADASRKLLRAGTAAAG